MPSNENREVHTESSCNLAAGDCERRIQDTLEAAVEYLHSVPPDSGHPHATAQILEGALDAFNAPLKAALAGECFRVVNPQMIGNERSIARALDQAIRELDELDDNGNVIAGLIDAREQFRALVHDCRLSQTIIDTLEISIIHTGRLEAEGYRCTASTRRLLALRNLMLAHYDDTGSEAGADRQERAWRGLQSALVIDNIASPIDGDALASLMTSFTEEDTETRRTWMQRGELPNDTGTHRDWGQGFSPDDAIARIAGEAIEKGELTPLHEVATGHVATFDTEPLVKHALDSVIADLTRIKGADMVPRDLIDGRAFILAAGTSQGEA